MSDALRAVWGAKRLWALHVAANAAWLAAAYAWLWIPDERIWQLLVSLLGGVLLATTFFWLHGGTCVFFEQKHSGWPMPVATPFRGPLRRVPPLILWGLVTLLLYWAVGFVADFVPRASDWLASALTLTFRTPVSPEYTLKFLSTLDWVVEWILLPLLLLPWGAEVAAKGFAGFAGRSVAAAWKVFRRGGYWVGYLVSFALGVYVPVQLVHWVPEVESLGGQAASLAARFIVAYLLFVTAWLVLASLLGRLRRAE
ncbi:MAG TPA: hypothetical protein VLB32_04680 [Candidatus Acidoferrales bacterium]|nr:hypothetical protein [Candidatus Acidoferrales bacterium]